MAGLRELSLVRSEKGHGGGWTIAQDLTTATPRDVYEALGSPGIFAMGTTPRLRDVPSKRPSMGQ